MIRNNISILLLSISFICCHKPKNDPNELPKPIDSVNHLRKDSAINTDNGEKIDHFQIKLEKTIALLTSWHFKKDSESIISKKKDLEKHWWLKIFTKKINKDTANFPTPRDWAKISSIHQFIFKKNWKFIIEEWRFLGKQDADRWLEIAINTKHQDDFKPPRICWVENNNLYFIVATAAKDWFEHSEELIKQFSGRKRALIELFNEPLEISTFKRKMKGSNSGLKNKATYLFQPDTAGIYYSYFLFTELARKYGESVAFRGMVLSTYIYGNEIGDYFTVNEKFIGIKSMLALPQLGIIDLVGKDMLFLANQFGLKASPNDLLIETNNGRMLIIQLEGDKVSWFNFLHTTLTDSSMLPEELKYYEETISKK